ncbi:MAG: outer membrane beta-barrel protein [Fermentimonas sp.]|jgi:hypothetical protein
MKTTKLIIAILCFVTAVAANAQLKVGFRAGGNISNFLMDNYIDKTNKLGLQGGITAEYMYSPNMGIQTAFLYSEKGTKMYIHKEESLNPNGKIDYTLFIIPKLGYLELPLHLVYKAAIAADSRISFSAGPYLAYGLSSRYLVKDKFILSGEISDFARQEAEESVIEIKRTAENEYQNIYIFDKYSPFDFGGGVAIGYEVNPFEVKLGCDISIINIRRDKNDQRRNRNIYISLEAKF